ncbi:MAG: hypothetical protein AAFY71_22255 [Bacteroidota bacterium]
MKNLQDIKVLLAPLLHYWWVMVACLLMCLTVGIFMASQVKAVYQARISLKLHKENFAQTPGGDLGMFVSANNISSEAYLLGSEYLINQVLDSLPFDITYTELIKSKSIDIYGESPFLVKSWSIHNPRFIDFPFQLSFLDSSTFEISYLINGTEAIIEGKWDQPIKTGDFELTLTPNYNNWTETLFFTHTQRAFSFQFNSRKKLISEFNDKNLLIKPMEDEVPIISIYLSHESGKKAMDFLNQLAKTYINEVVKVKKEKVRKAITFIKNELDSVKNELTIIEGKMVRYKQNEQVVSFKLDADASLNQMMSLTKDLVAVELEKQELTQLQAYLEEDSLFLISMPDLGSVKDANYTQNLLALNGMIARKNQLRDSYTANHPKVELLEKEIQKEKEKIKNAVNNAIETTDVFCNSFL